MSKFHFLTRSATTSEQMKHPTVHTIKIYMYVRAYIIWWLCTLCSLSNVAVWFEKSQLLMFFYNINVFLDGFCKDKQLFRIIALFARFFARFF